MRALLTSCFLNKLWYHDDDIVLKVISEKNPDYFQYIMPTWLQLSKLEINFKTRLFSIVKFKFLSRMNYRLNDSLNLVYFTGEVSFLRFYCRISFKWERCTNWHSEILNYQCVTFTAWHKSPQKSSYLSQWHLPSLSFTSWREGREKTEKELCRIIIIIFKSIWLLSVSVPSRTNYIMLSLLSIW